MKGVFFAIFALAATVLLSLGALLGIAAFNGGSAALYAFSVALVAIGGFVLYKATRYTKRVHIMLWAVVLLTALFVYGTSVYLVSRIH